MIVDAHTHIFSEGMRSDPASYGERDPSFELIYARGGARMTGAEEALAAMDAAGVDAAVICGFPWRDPELAREGNDYILECLERHPGRFIGLCCVPPAAGKEAAREARRCLEAGMRGIGELHGEPQAFDPRDFELMQPLVEAAADFGVPLMIHVNEPVGHHYAGKGRVSPEVVYPLILEFPQVDWILPHWGGGLFFYELMPEVSGACRRVYYDSAASPFLYRPDVYRVASQVVGPERVLYGTDFPLLGYERTLRDLDAAGLEGELKAGILGGNAARLFRLPRARRLP